MFAKPKKIDVDFTGGCFSSNKTPLKIGTPQKIDPKTVIGSVGQKVGGLMPIEKDSFLGGFIGGLNQVLANPVTKTDGRKKLATVDPYAKVVNTPQNELSSILSNYFGTPGVVLGGIVKNEPLRKLTSEFIRTGKVDSEQSKKLIKSFNNNLLAGVSEMTAPWMKEVQDMIGIDGVDSKQLMSSLLGVEGAPRPEKVLSQNPTISMIVKGKEFFANADFSSTEGIFKVVDNLSANKQLSSMFDLKTEFAIMNVVTKGLMAFDAPDLFSKVGKWFRDQDDNTEKGSYNRETTYYLDNLDNAIDNSSMTFLEGLLKRVPASKILDENRNFVNDFLGSFTLRYDQEPSKEIGIRLSDLMTQIDPLWNKTQLTPGKGEYVSDLKPFKLLSRDAEKVFTLTELYDVELSMANYYTVKPVSDYMRSLYPFAPL